MRLGLPVAALAAALLACACQPQSPPAAGADAVDGPGAATGSTAAPAVDLSRRPIDDLKASGSRALREGRLHAPAGDSAIEYWLEAKRRDPDDAALASAITDLQPYLLIACEQAIARRDVGAAQRLHGLIAVSDPHAPACGGWPARSPAWRPISKKARRPAREQDMRLAAVEAQRVRADADARAAATRGVCDTCRSGSDARAAAASSPATSPPLADGDAVPGRHGRCRLRPRAQPRSRSRPRRCRACLHQPAPRIPRAAEPSRRRRGAGGFTIRPDGSVTARAWSVRPRPACSTFRAGRGRRVPLRTRRQQRASAITVRFSLDQ